MCHDSRAIHTITEVEVRLEHFGDEIVVMRAIFRNLELLARNIGLLHLWMVFFIDMQLELPSNVPSILIFDGRLHLHLAVIDSLDY